MKEEMENGNDCEGGKRWNLLELLRKWSKGGQWGRHEALNLRGKERVPDGRSERSDLRRFVPLRSDHSPQD
jgi:hypothetical protein